MTYEEKINTLTGLSYLRFDIRREQDGNVVVPLYQIQGFMRMAAREAKSSGLQRLLIILDIPEARHEYSIAELEMHVLFVDENFSGLRVAYVNPMIKQERLIFISGALRELGNMNCQAFLNEADALAWLLTEDQ